MPPAEYPKAATTLEHDPDALLTFFDFTRNPNATAVVTAAESTA